MRFPRWFYLGLFGSLVVTGCGNEGDLDSDGDGVVAGEDCAPFDEDIFPGQTEQCDGVDINCDGVADDGFDDNDNDGIATCGGNPGGNFREDCDDNNPNINPGQIELCDGVDNNCNDQTDEVVDIDGDGFTNCGAQPDCDDGNSDVNPAATEVCDSRDNNCNNLIDEGFDNDDDGQTTCRGDCDDNNANTRLGADEICDNSDNNCNNEVDEGFDADEDGFTSCQQPQADCDDFIPDVNPGEAEVCDLRDNNCNGQVDEGFDADGDFSSICGGDCNDNNSTVAVGKPELNDGLDNDCNGLIDEPFIDNDGDGFTEAQGDCDDTIFQVGPGAIEFQGNAVDDDCDGTIDEALVPCDTANLSNANPFDFAKAIGLCNGEVLNAQFVGGVAASRAIATQFGTNTGTLNRPAEGNKMATLSTGQANTTNHDSGTAFDGTLGGGCTSTAHPFPSGDPGACGAADPATVCDLTEVRLTIRVPTNAQSFSYQFQFWSSEYPTFRCTIFDDTFLALLTSGALGPEQNISFDNNNKVVSINTGFFDICLDDLAGAPRDINGNGVIQAGEVVPTTNDCSIENGAALASTGFIFDNDATNNGAPDLAGSQSLGAGATTLLTTFSPVLPGETVTLRFILLDEGDDQLDSFVAFDNFLWGLNAIPGPVTQQ